MAVILTYVSVFMTSVALSTAEPTTPNIVLILADDVGVETLGCYGGESYKTPNVDALAQQGMRFRYAYSMPSCHPTRIALLTGRYPSRVGGPRWGSFPASLESNTVAHVLQKAGYATAITGKWQLSLLGKDRRHPERLGFQHWSLFGWHEGPRYYNPLIWENGQERDDVADRYGPDVYTESLIEFMGANRERPFFAFYSMALCHDVTDDLREPVPYGPRGRYDSYREMMVALDDQVGRIVRAVDDLGLGRNTVILFTADNGTAQRSIIRAEDGKYIREPVVSRRDGRDIPGGKGTLRDGGTNVPMIARWSGRIPAGTVVNDLVDLTDILPTCTELAGQKVASDWAVDGMSFASRLTSNEPARRRWTYAEKGKRSWVRTARWKRYNDNRWFDMQADAGETKPIARDKVPDRSVVELLDAAARTVAR